MSGAMDRDMGSAPRSNTRAYGDTSLQMTWPWNDNIMGGQGRAHRWWQT